MSGITAEPDESQQWYTPPEIFEALDLTFDLDPCSPGAGKSFVPALTHYTAAEDGLASPWQGLVWVHPPHGPQSVAWVEKLAAHGNGIALLVTETTHLDTHQGQADLACRVGAPMRFFRGGIAKRVDEPVRSITLLAYGQRAATALAVSGLGTCTPSFHV